MNRQKQFRFITLLLLFLLESVKASLGQVGSYFNLLLPYEMQGMTGRRIGGVTVALPDEIPAVVSNPANLAHLTHTVIFLSIRNTRTKLSFKETDTKETSSQTWYQTDVPNYTAAALPFNAFKRSWVIAAAYNGKQFWEFDGSHLGERQNSTSTIERKGDIQSASLGFAGHISSNISLGVGWTKWFGKNKWNLNGSHSESGNGSLDYTGQGWQIGLQGQFTRLSVGAVIYFPHELMTGSSLFRDELIRAGELQHSQEFNGALNLGVAYHLSSHWTIGFGYGYQKSFLFQTQQGQWHYQERFKGSSKFSGGVEYDLAFNKAHLPLYLGYQRYQMPKSSGHSPFGFLLMSKSDKDLIQNELVLGASLIFKTFGFYFDTKWTRSSFHIDGLPPPWF
ncbi:MAG: hypothetical protein ONB05_03940 [candidate division KSB1 bacterium]|nr:hypothetical protein [candidate division KSB1 bacterium]